MKTVKVSTMVHYIGYIVDKSNAKNYICNVPGAKKMEYIISCLSECGFKTRVFSLCRQSGNGICYGKNVTIDNHTHLRYRASCVAGLFGKVIDCLMFNAQLFLYTLNNIKKNDSVIVYHSVKSTRLLAKMVRMRKANWILEVEELYGYGATRDDPKVLREIADIKKFPKYIFVNNVLPQMLGANKNYTVCYGVYNAKLQPERVNDGKHRVVYAGTIEQSKVGAYTAVEVAKHLPVEYELHVAGFGTDAAIEKLKQMIKTNNEQYPCKIEYHGKLDGDDLSKLLFSCDIGVSSYVIRLPFSNCVFPSKLTTYVCHGLKVVVGRSENFEKAEIAENWTYYDSNEPKIIAEAVMSAALKPAIDCTELIKKLDTEFKTWLCNNIGGDIE